MSINAYITSAEDKDLGHTKIELGFRYVAEQIASTFEFNRYAGMREAVVVNLRDQLRQKVYGETISQVHRAVRELREVTAKSPSLSQRDYERFNRVQEEILKIIDTCEINIQNFERHESQVVNRG